MMESQLTTMHADFSLQSKGLLIGLKQCNLMLAVLLGLQIAICVRLFLH